MAQETILVVDADEKSQKLLEVSFKTEGYEVLLTETIKDAIKTIGARAPDLIICDTDLPDGDGFTLCEQLKRNPKFAAIPFLFLTENEELSRKMKAFELGAAEYLTKPIFIKDVTSRVKLQLQELNKHRIHDAHDEEVVTGSLDEITVIDLLQTIESRDRSGILDLHREEGISAQISFHKGNILDAHCGPLRGEEALYRIMLWPRGTFALEYKEVESADHIEKDSSALLIEGMRRFESWNDMIGTLPHLSRIFLADQDAASLGLPREVEHLVALFDGTRTLRHVVDQSPVDDLTTLRIIRKLLDESLLEDVTPDASSLRQSAQHTNLASWLSDRTVRDERSEEGGVTRRKARLFDTTPGFKSVPGLNADSIVQSEAQINEVARTLDEISAPPSGDIEPGRPPEGASEEEITHWRFHWDQEAGQAVATPREKPVDPFALNELEHDLQRIERMRREEEARRIAAERAFAASHHPPSTLDEIAPAQSVTPAREEPPQQPRDVTKELHRKSVLAEVARRTQQKQDPRAGIEDMIDRVTPRNSFAEQVAQDYEDGDDAFTSRQRTDQFIPILEHAASQDDIETAEIEREQDAVPSASDAPSTPLIALGAPEDSADEPTVSEQAAEAYKAGVSLEQQSIEDARTDEEAPVSGGLEDEESDADLEEVMPAQDAAEDRAASQAEDFIAHRNPRNQELVHAEVELKRGSDEVPEDEDTKEVTPDEDEEDELSLAGALDDEEDVAAVNREEEEEEKEEKEEEEEQKDEEVVATTTDKEEAAAKAPEPEEESYLLDAPLFADEEEGFNKAGLFGVILVIAALVGVIFFALGKEEPVKPKEPVVAILVDAAPDLPEALDTAPDLVLAILDAPEDMPTEFVLREVTEENVLEMGSLFGTHTYAQTASMVLSLSGTDMTQVTDPIATLNDISGDAPLDAAPDMIADVPDAPADLVADKPVVDKPVEDKPVANNAAMTIEDQLKEVSSLVRREKFKQALKPARELAKNAPDSGEAAGLLGSAELNGADDPGAAIKSFERAQSLGYRSSTMYLDLATAYFMKNNRDKARKTYEAFLKSYPTHKQAKDVQSILDNQF